MVVVQRVRVSNSVCAFPTAQHHPNTHHELCIGSRWNRPAEGLAEGGGIGNGGIEHGVEIGPLRHVPEETTQGRAGTGLAGQTGR